MTEVARVWFLTLCVLGIVGFFATVVSFWSRREDVERKIGPLPVPAPLIVFGLAALIVATRVGELSNGWTLVRGLGIALSVYALILIPMTALTLRRLFVPGAAVLRDHVLVTSGPFRLVRHPLLSAVSAFWLGAALGTLNWLLLALWPLLLIAVHATTRHEEELLRGKFGEAYDAYAARTGSLFPKLLGRGQGLGARTQQEG